MAESKKNYLEQLAHELLSKDSYCHFKNQKNMVIQCLHDCSIDHRDEGLADETFPDPCIADGFIPPLHLQCLAYAP